MNRNEVNEYYIEKGGTKIHAKLTFPENSPEKLPVVIISHGLTGNMEEWHILGAERTCLENGFATLKVELYGHGQSDGDFKDHTITEWVEQLIFVIEYVKNLDFTESILLMGHSQGGLAVILAAGLHADNIRALIPLSPAINIVTDCRKGVFFDAAFDPEKLPEEVSFWGGIKLGNNYLRTAQRINIEEAVKAYEGPVLLVHGSADGAVPCEGSVELDKMYKNSRLAVIPEDGHCYENHLDKALEALSGFLKEIRPAK